MLLSLSFISHDALGKYLTKILFAILDIISDIFELKDKSYFKSKNEIKKIIFLNQKDLICVLASGFHKQQDLKLSYLHQIIYHQLLFLKLLVFLQE